MRWTRSNSSEGKDEACYHNGLVVFATLTLSAADSAPKKRPKEALQAFNEEAISKNGSQRYGISGRLFQIVYASIYSHLIRISSPDPCF
jgi:hypothetical protein